jgi:hypothetical protein
MRIRKESKKDKKEISKRKISNVTMMIFLMSRC